MAVLTGDSQPNVLTGSDESDEIYGGGGDDILRGGAGDDYLEDGYGNDEVYGDAGDDTINNIGGSDLFNGGDGNDTLITDISTGFDERSFAVGFNTVTGTHGRLNSDIGQDQISAIENFTLRGNFNAEVTGSDGDNIFITDAGDDILRGGAGDDTLSGWMGNDEIYGGRGDDVIINTGGEDLFDGGEGVDTLVTDLSQTVKDELGFSNWDFDIVFDLTATDPHMRHYGLKPDGSDYAWDEIYNIENYTLIGDFDIQLIGDDRNNRLIADTGDDILRGGLGNDYLEDGAGNDEVFGGDGDDTINNIGGTDIFDGGYGNDTLITDISTGFDERSFEVGFNTVAGTHGRLNSNVGQDIITGIENFTLLGNFNAEVRGGDENNRFITDAGDDEIYGGNGNDLLYGDSSKNYLKMEIPAVVQSYDGSWATTTHVISRPVNIYVNPESPTFKYKILDALDGGQQRIEIIEGEFPEILSFDDASSGLEIQNIYVSEVTFTDETYVLFEVAGTLDLKNTTFTLLASGEGSHFAGINGPDWGNVAELDFDQNETFDSRFKEGVNVSFTDWNTNSNSEIVLFGVSDDYLDGGDGADVISTGGGADIALGGAGADVVSLAPDGLWGYGSYAKNVGSANSVGTENLISIKGYTQFSDVVDGGAGIDELVLTESKDAFFLHDSYSALHSTLSTTADNTTARLIDLEMISAGNGDDLIDLTSENFSLASIDMTLNGDAGNDILWAAQGDDTLNGGTGNDILNGSSGDDTLTGGSGADIFEFTATSGNDTITDFNKDEDELHFYYRKGEAEETAVASINNGVVTWDAVTVDLGDALLDLSDLNITYQMI